MQLTQKHIIGIIISGLVLVGGYFAVQDTTPSQSDGVNTSTGTNNTISQSDTGVETDTGKRLEIVSKSNTGWGMSPFGSGKPLTEEEKKSEFKRPNTEWKTRTLQLADGRWMTYVFGEGNPAGVSMSLEQIKEIDKICTDETSPEGRKLIDSHVCSQESGTMFYMTPEIEKHLLLALSDSNWIKLATECKKNFKFMETSDAFINAQNDSEYPLFDRVFSPGWLDMDRYFYIDPNTGLKLLNRIRVNNIAGFLIDASHYGRRKDDGWINPHGDCVDRYAREIVRNLYIAQDLYKLPLSYTQ